MKSVSPTVSVIAHTSFVPSGMIGDVMELDSSLSRDDGRHVIEYAGRLCYMSHNKPNPATARNSDYIRNVISQHHYSVLEHVSVSFYITGISRNCSHELVRHRHFSFSELSQRYVDPVKAGLGFVEPPAARGFLEYERIADGSIIDYGNDYRAMVDEAGVRGKRAREVARAVLPSFVETRIVMSGNLRSWMEFVSKRDHPAADAEIQRLAKLIYGELVELYPSVFGCRELWDEGWSQSAPAV